MDMKVVPASADDNHARGLSRTTLTYRFMVLLRQRQKLCGDGSNVWHVVVGLLVTWVENVRGRGVTSAKRSAAVVKVWYHKAGVEARAGNPCPYNPRPDRPHCHSGWSAGAISRRRNFFTWSNCFPRHVRRLDPRSRSISHTWRAIPAQKSIRFSYARAFRLQDLGYITRMDALRTLCT